MRLLGTAWVGVFIAALLATLLGVTTASAEGATIAYHDPSLLPLSTRLASELQSEGYQVYIEVLPAEPGCTSEAEQPQTPPDSSTERGVWIRIGRAVSPLDSGCALILYASPSGWRHARVTATTVDAMRFSIQVAEALNGLRSRELRTPTTVEEPAATPPPMPPPVETQRAGVSLGATASVLLDVTHRDPLLGVGIVAELPLGNIWSLQLDGLWSVTALRFSEAQTELEARLSWLRLGLAVSVLSGPVDLKLAASGGHVVTWATADVVAPDVARADVGHSAVFSVGGSLVYPTDTPLRLSAALRASTLVPSVRFELPSGPTDPFGVLLGEATLGLLANW